jgi:hypothetical protein
MVVNIAAIHGGVSGNIDATWSLKEVYAVAEHRYGFGSKTATQSRMAMLRAWGNVVGRNAASRQLKEFVGEFPTRAAAAEALGCGVAALRSLSSYFDELLERPETFSISRDTRKWLDEIPVNLPRSVREAIIREKAASEIEVVLVELTAHEFRDIEQAVMDEFVLSGLGAVVQWLRDGDSAFVQSWAAKRLTLAHSLGAASTGSRLLERGSQLGSVTGGIHAAFDVVRTIFGTT